MRSKEGSSDYRYFPEPDIPPIIITDKEIADYKASLPELPSVKRARFETTYSLNDEDARVLTLDQDLSDYYEEVVEICGDAKLSASFVLTILMKHLKEELIGVREQKVTSEMMGALLKMVVSGKISNNVAKGEIFEEMYVAGKSPEELVKEKGLEQVSDAGAIEEVCKRVVDANPSIVADIKGGKDRAIGSLIGLVMKEMKGKANPKIVDKMVRKML